MFRYLIHKTQPLVCVLNQMNSEHVLLFYFIKNHFNNIIPFTSRYSKQPLSFGFSLLRPVSIFSTICDKCSIHLTCSYRTTQIIFGEGTNYKTAHYKALHTFQLFPTAQVQTPPPHPFLNTSAQSLSLEETKLHIQVTLQVKV